MAASGKTYDFSTLSADIRFLGNLLGTVIREQHGEDALALVEQIRLRAKERRGGDQAALDELMATIGQLDLAANRILIKAFSNYFQLINIAEDQQRIRVLREREAVNGLRESIDAAVVELKAAGLGADEMRGLLDRLRIRLVLTAHPSEAKRKEVLIKLRRIAGVMAVRDRQALLPREERDTTAILIEEIEELWQTRPTRAASPRVTDEVDFGLYFLTTAIMDVVADVYADLRGSLEAHYPGEDWSRLPPVLRFASWVGGDRDGNPNVTPEVTLQTLKMLHRAARRVYLAEIAHLRDHLTQSVDEVSISSLLRYSLPERGAVVKRYPGEPYRQKMALIHKKLKAGGYASGAELLVDLRRVEESLKQNRGGRVAGGALRRLIQKVELFGLHLVPLEVRQDARVHAAALDALFREYGLAGDYLNLPEADKQQLLTREIANKRPLFPEAPGYGPEVDGVIATWRMIAEAHQRYGPLALDTYIASHTEQPSDVLAMLLLASEVGVQDNLQIVPLFETIADLHHAPDVMRTLFNNPAYSGHLKARGMNQQIMIGYSDSNKDGGYFSSNWNLYVAQKKLAEVCEAGGVTLELFHGRGGSIGRGGGPTNRAIQTHPPESMHGPIKITEQGEVVAYRYSNAEIGRRHLHQVMHAALLVMGAPKQHALHNEWQAAMGILAEAGHAAYRKLVYETPGFLDYWQQATPIRQLSRLPIGSRPVKRSQGGFDAIRAIPWVFSWMQSRALIPSWYGVGHALEAYCQQREEGTATLRAMFSGWPFFKMLVMNLELDLAKADMGIAALYAGLVENEALRQRIFGEIQDEHARAREYICQITGQAHLLDHSPVMQRSIEHRNPYVDPLNFIQVVLLRELHQTAAGTPEHEAIAGLLLATVNGIAAGMKTTG